MTPQEIWNCLRDKLSCKPAVDYPSIAYRLSLVDRIDNQVATMRDQALSHSTALTGFRDRILDLELRNEQVDATYIRTVTLALSENLEKRDAAINDRYNRLEASFAAAELELRNLLNACEMKRTALEDRYDALIRKLRAGLE